MKSIREFSLWPPATTVSMPLGSDVLGVVQRYADLLLICEVSDSETMMENREFITVEQLDSYINNSIPDGELQYIGIAASDGNSKYSVVYEKLDSSV